jgi:hypothetical protein
LSGDFRVPPILAGLAVDVSGSMAEAIDNPAGPDGNRLDAVRESVRDLAQCHGVKAGRASGFGFR